MCKKLFSLFFAVLLALTLVTVPVQAGVYDAEPADRTSCSGWPEGPEIESECAILMEARTGSILYAKNMEETCYPASITKIMTALLTLENCSLDDTVTFSYRATHELEEGSTSIARTEGEEMSVEDCLYALLLASANEVAQGLAEHVGGTIEDFAEMMTDRAKELGCENTHFANPSGLNDESHYTTCKDMAIIMRAAIQNEDFLTIDSTLSYTIPATNKHDEELPIAMKHKLLQNNDNHYDGAVAGKTGYTTIALNTLVTYAVRGDMELICVVMKSLSTHYADTVTLLDYGFDNFTMYQLGATDISGLTSGSTEDLTGAVIPDDEWLVIPSSMEFSGLDTRLDLTKDETEENGARTVGTIHYSYNGTELGTALLTIPAVTVEETSSGKEATAETPAETEEKTGLVTKILGRLERLPGVSLLASLSLVQNHPWLLWAIPLILLILVLLILILILSLLLPNRSRRRRRSSNQILYRRNSSYGYIAPSPKHRRRRKNKYKMKL